MADLAWRERWIAWRNRRLADPKFQHWAAGFPLTRGLARRRQMALFDVVAGFVYSQVLAATLRLGLLTQLQAGPLSLDAVAEAADLPRDVAARLLAAAAALDLTEPLGDGRWVLGPQGAALLGAPGLAEMVGHHDRLYRDLADVVGVLRQGGGAGELAAYWPYATGRGSDSESVATYSRLMAATQPAVAAEVLDAYDLRRHRVVMDVGGGEGAFLEAVATRAPALGLRLFDLPAVADRARDRLGQRLMAIGGDFLTDPLPMGADLITLVRIVHDHSDEGALSLLRSVRRALPKGGALLIAEPMSGGRNDRVSDAYFGLYLLAMGRGRARSHSEIEALLERAGFAPPRWLPTRVPALLSIAIATPATGVQRD